LLLYGASLTYGFAGTTLFSGIMSTVGNGVPLGLLFGLVFMISGLAFKVSAVPFHMWSPDVYEGAPTPVTAFFSTAPKMAAVGLLARLLHDAFGTIVNDWSQVLVALAVGSMFLGAVAAIGQRDFKRLMAYSSIAHMGFALMGLAAGSAEGVEAMLIYMAIYVTMNVGTFALILSLEKDGVPVTSIDSLHGLAKRDPMRAFGILVLMFSLAGVPPMLGFLGKLSVLQAAVNGGLAWLAVAGVIASVIGAFYYLRIVYFVYFGKVSDGTICRMDPVQSVLFTGASIMMLLGIVNLFGIEPLATLAASALVN
jgi:NADH-quinone oxidoreductase subunit N